MPKTFTTYGVIQILDPTPVKTGGQVLNNNFKALNDTFSNYLPLTGGTINGTLASGVTTIYGSPSLASTASSTVTTYIRPYNDGVSFQTSFRFDIAKTSAEVHPYTRVDMVIFGGYGVGDWQSPVQTWLYDGNVGIGTIAPTARLEVNNGLYDGILQRWSGGEASTYNLTLRNASVEGNVFYAFDLNTSYGGVDSTNLLVLNSNKVGIGTASPSYKLDIVGDLRTSGTAEIGSTSVLTGGFYFTTPGLYAYGLQQVSYPYGSIVLYNCTDTATGDMSRNIMLDRYGNGSVTGSWSASSYYVGSTAGVSGSFTTTDGKTVTVSNGIITQIV
jgi:hypothetical protein